MFSAFFFILKPYTGYAHVVELGLLAYLGLVGYALGWVLFHGLYGMKNAPRSTVFLPLGWGVLSYGMFGLAWVQAFNAAMVGCLLAGVGIICLPWAWKGGAFSLRQTERWRTWLVSLHGDERLVLIALGISILFSYFCSLMPPTQSDGLRYHLSVPALYLKHGGFYLIPHIAFSNFPFLIEFLYAIPLAFGLDSVPKLIHASFFWMTLRLIYQLGVRLGDRRTGLYAALLFAALPFAPIFASWSFIEMGLTFYTLLSFSLCLAAAESIRTEPGRVPVPGILLAGFAAGFLLSCKYTSLSTVFLLAIFFLFSRKPFFPRDLWIPVLGMFLFGIVAMLVASPWYIKNVLLLGNPVYPFARSLFPSPGWTDFNALFFQYHAGMKGSFNLLRQSPWWEWIVDALMLPFRVTFFPGDKEWHPEDFGHWQLGPVWLTLAPFLLIYRNWNYRKILHLIAGLFLYFVWAYTYRDSRFLLPAMAVIAPLFSVLLDDLAASRFWTRWCFGAGIFYCYLFLFAVILLPTLNAPWWVVSGTISREDYLENVCESTRCPNQAFHWLREHTRPEEKVLLHGIEHPFYCPNDFVGADWFNTDPLIAWSWEHPSVDDLLDHLRKEGIRYVVYYDGKIKKPGYFQFYRFFRLPPPLGYQMLSEYRAEEYASRHYPFAFQEWWRRFETKFHVAEERSPNIKALETLLDGGILPEVFQYNYVSPVNPENRDHILILRIPEKKLN